MSIALYAFTCGFLKVPSAFLLEQTEGWIDVPVPVYLIVHPKGKVLFDSGLNILTQTDPTAYIGEAGMAFNTFCFKPGEEVSGRLRAMSIAPEEVAYIVNSHLHYDHAGGNALVPNAEIIVQCAEWEHAMAQSEDDIAYRRKDFDTGQPVRRIEGEYDLFGDGTLTCLPTFGHSPGHQSLRVRADGGEFILCGDACYLRRSLDHLHLPGIVADREAARAVFMRLREMQAGGARIMFGHDLEFWASVPQAPARLG